MPYVSEEAKARLVVGLPQTSGELNFLLTQEALDYLRNKGMSYQTLNDILGAFDGAAKEFYRRVVVPYEDLKIKENGDVYNEVGGKRASSNTTP